MSFNSDHSVEKRLGRSAFLFLMIFILCSPSTYPAGLNNGPKQVTIEAKIIYLSDVQRDFKADFGFAITPMQDGSTKLEVSSMARGQGSDFRKWIPQNPTLITIDKDRILPSLTEKIYLQKPSVMTKTGAATILFAALGSQYVGYASQAEASPGKVCPVTGQVESSGEPVKHTGASEAIDRVGMAAGLGLLSSQAKGELEGQKSTFILKDIPLTGLNFRTEVLNKEKNNLVIIIKPVLIKFEN